jgi:tRNA threonylcarbamoyladenosine biosynthesis protein TsaB
MLVLGIETATDMASVALMDDSGPVAEYRMRRSAGHAESLPLAIHSLFDLSENGFDSLGGVAASIGPGSFTGLRIGLGLAKGMALALGLPLAVVPTLDALVEWIIPAPWAAAVIPSQRNEVYIGLYRFQAQGWKPAALVRFVPTERVEEELPEGEGIVAGPTTESLKDRIHRPEVRIVRVLPSAFAVAEAGIRQIAKGETADLDAAVPFYLKRFKGVA